VEELLLSAIECDVKQMEIHTAEPSHYEFEIYIAKLEKYKSPGIDQFWQN
jgi:hypothetical protein